METIVDISIINHELSSLIRGIAPDVEDAHRYNPEDDFNEFCREGIISTIFDGMGMYGREDLDAGIALLREVYGREPTHEAIRKFVQRYY